MSDTPTPTPTPAGPSGKRRLLKWGLGAVVVVGLLIGFLPAILSTSVAGDVIRSWLADNVDRKVEFASLDVSWGHGIRLEGLKVAGDGGSDRPLLVAPLVEIDVPLLPLAMKKVRVRNFLVPNAVVHIEERDEGNSSAQGVLKTRKVARKHRPAEEAEPKDAAPAEESILPEIHLPIEIRNLTVVYRNREGKEAVQTGIDFTGRLDTREGPTTFELNVPTGAGTGMRVAGEMTLFEPDGTMLSAERRKLDATIALTKIDAAQNRDFLRLMLGETPVAGTLDAKVVAHMDGLRAKGTVDLRLSHLGYGDAAAKAAARQGDDLTMTGAFESGDGKFRLDGWKVRADGLTIDANLSGSAEALDGAATVDADLARMAGALHAVGVTFDASVEGKLAGSMKFTPSPSKGTGDFTLTGFKVAGLVDGRPAVPIDSAQIRFEVAPSKERFELTSFEFKLADLATAAHGSRAADGTLDFTATAKGDLGGLLARVRDLGFLPGEFAVNGDIDTEMHVSGKPGALSFELPKFVLTESDVRIEATGTRAAGGALDFRASGSGDLGKLFGRAAAAGAGPKGLGDVKGRFAFDATAKGAEGALVVDVSKLRVEGDLNLDAHARLGADGSIDAEVADLSGRVNDLLLLARRMAVLDRDLTLDGRLAATATVKGTREKPEIPRATLKLTDGPLLLDASGSVDGSGALLGDAAFTGDLGVIADLVHRAGFVAERPPLAGRIEAHAKASGTRDKIDVPDFRVLVTKGPADVDVGGSYRADGTISATANVTGTLDRLTDFAFEQGWTKRKVATGGAFTLRAAVSGTREEFEVPRAKFEMTGPVTAEIEGTLDAKRKFTTAGKLSGPLQTFADLAAAHSGEPSRRVEGTIETAFAAEGKPDKFDVRVPRIAVRSRGLSMDAEAARTSDGTMRGAAKLGGPVAEALELLHSFGFALDSEATGRIDASVTGSLAGPKADGALTLVATDLDVAQPKFGDGPFREPRLTVSVPSVKFDLDTKALEPMKAKVTLEGAELDVTAKKTGDVVGVDGRISADAKFARNHPELLSGVAFDSISGPVRFEGDVSKGRENAAGWTGGFELDAAGVTAPHVQMKTAKLVGKIAGGVLTVDPIDAILNGGPVKGSATVGLVGEAPSHHLVLTGKDVELDADLAPLVARASPLFAIGEAGKTGGKAGLDLDLTASGFGADAIKKSLTGKGTVAFDNAFVQSTNWIGELAEFLGIGSRIDIASVKVPFEVKDSHVNTGEIPIDGGGLALRLGGNAGLDGKLDYAMRVKTASGGGIFAKLGSLLDKDGYLPLRLGGTISKPKLKLPDTKDLLKGELGGLLGGLKDKKDEPKPADDPEPAKGKGKGKKKKPAEETPPAPPAETPPKTTEPPPPPPASETPKKPDEPPPPPAPKSDEPPPPPPPAPKSDEPPPPPPPAPKSDEPPPPPPPAPKDDPPPPPPPGPKDDPPPPPPPK